LGLSTRIAEKFLSRVSSAAERMALSPSANQEADEQEYDSNTRCNESGGHR